MISFFQCCAHHDDGDSLGNDDELVHLICMKGKLSTDKTTPVSDALSTSSPTHSFRHSGCAVVAIGGLPRANSGASMNTPSSLSTQETLDVRRFGVSLTLKNQLSNNENKTQRLRRVTDRESGRYSCTYVRFRDTTAKDRGWFLRRPLTWAGEVLCVSRIVFLKA